MTPTAVVTQQPSGWRPGTTSRPSIPMTNPTIRVQITDAIRLTRLVCPAMEVLAEIAANVWQVPAAPGQVVAEGDTIAILESMKMEIPVLAPETGRVVKLLVAEGAPVREGQDVALFEAQ